jgi:hypothetical protein
MDVPLRLDLPQRRVLLREFLAADREAATRMRWNMLLLLDDGWPVEEVTNVTYSTMEEVKNVVRRFREGGVGVVLRGTE